MDGRMRLRDGVNYYNGNEEELLVNGIYDKERKLYWNKNSGKWVGKKVKVSDNWFWGFNVYENLNEDWIVDNLDFVLGNEKYGYIDKIGLFFEELRIREGRYGRDELVDGSEGLYIDNRNIIRILGSKRYKNLIKLFERIGYLEVIEGKVLKYDINKRIKLYKVSWSKIGRIIGFKFIENDNLIKGLLREYSAKSIINEKELNFYKGLEFDIDGNKWDNIVDRRYNRKVIDRKNKINWGFVGKSEIERLKNKIISKSAIERDLRLRMEIVEKDIRYLNNGFIRNDLFKRDDFSGRIHTPLSRLNKELRKSLVYKGDELVDLDLRSSYISCLVYLVEYLNRNKKTLNKKSTFGFDGLFFGEDDKLKENWNNRKKIWSEYYNVDEDYYDLGECEFDFDELVENWCSEFFEEWVKFENLLLRIEIRGNERLILWKEGRNISNDPIVKSEIKELEKKNYEIEKYLNLDFNSISNYMVRSSRLLDKVRNELNKKIDYRDRNNKWFIEFKQWSDDDWFGRGRIYLIGGKLDDFLNSEVIYRKRGKDNYWIYSLDRGLLETAKHIFFDFGDGWRDDIEEVSCLDLGERIIWWSYDGFGLKENEVDNNLFNGRYEVKSKYLSKKDEINLRERIKNFKYVGEIDKDELDKFIQSFIERYGKEYYLEGNIEGIKDDRGGNHYENYGRNQLYRWRDLVFGNGEFGIDFYSWCGLNNGWISKYDRELYNRDYYKELIMRLLFMQRQYNSYYDIEEIKRIFGDLWYLIEDLKQISISSDGSGKKFDYELMSKNNHKYVSLILGYIEVDVMNLIKSFIDGVMDGDIGYIQIHDGLLVRKKDYKKLKFYINNLLRKELGYMFSLK
jgi:hypothetical protein